MRRALVLACALAGAPGCAQWVPMPALPRGQLQDLGRVRVHVANQSFELDDARAGDGTIQGRALGPVNLVDGVRVEDARNDVVSVREGVLTRQVERRTGRALRTGLAAGGALLVAATVVAGTVLLAAALFAPVY